MSQDLKKVLTSVDRSTKSLTAAADALVKTVAEQTAQVATLTAQQVAIATDIEFKQNELEGIEQATATKLREANAELALSVKENAETVLASLLKERGLVTVTPARVRELEDAVIAANDAKEEEVRTAVETAVAAVKNTYEAQLAKQLSEHKVEIAQLNANATSDKKTITLLEGQVADAREDLAEERAVRVKTEEARSRASGVTVNTTK